MHSTRSSEEHSSFPFARDASNEISLNATWEIGVFADVLYGRFILPREGKTYQIIADKGQVNEVDYLEEYNITFPDQMRLVFFQEGINRIRGICRILRLLRGDFTCWLAEHFVDLPLSC